ncbi:MAG: hypothetical protein J7K40_05230 [candidate division Zixibacteria bacterium]|nr:hypothetical protein [candidate division Zixibacteria bacterium]
MKANNIKYIIIILLAVLFLFQISDADEKFRYNFTENDTSNYTIKIDSRIEFTEHKSLAQLFNIDNITHNIIIKIELITESVMPDKNAKIKAVFRKISAVMIAGDSVFVDDGSNWGAAKPGSEYVFIITPRGEIVDFFGKDTTAAQQGALTTKLFFPTYPDDAINEGYNWDDSLSFKFEMQKNKLTEIQSQFEYLYNSKGIGEYDNYYHFSFTIDGLSTDKLISLNGGGEFYTDNANKRIIKNSGDFDIDAFLSLSAFGFPEGIGNDIPVNIQSKIEIELDEDR